MIQILYFSQPYEPHIVCYLLTPIINNSFPEVYRFNFEGKVKDGCKQKHNFYHFVKKASVASQETFRNLLTKEKVLLETLG